MPTVPTPPDPIARPDLSLAAVLDAARHDLTQRTVRGQAGRVALRDYTARIDGLLSRLHDQAPRPSSPVAVCAIGGYGRFQQAWHSDIDVLVVFDGPIDAPEEAYLRGLLHPLWDLRFTVGQQVRGLEDFDTLEMDNPEFLLALADARFVAGDASIFERFSAKYHTPDNHVAIIDSLLSLIDERYAKFNRTMYQLEPDIKEAPGSLRDLVATRTIASLGGTSLGSADAFSLEDAEDFLLRIRSILHLESGRNQNVLTHELQEKAAERLSYPGAPRQRVERLMSDYFRHARTIFRSLAWARRTVRAAAAPAMPAMAVGANLERTGDGIRFIDAVAAADRPTTWLAVFQAALDESTNVSDDALSCIRSNVSRFSATDFLPTATERAEVLRFLRPRKGLYARLSEMHECGLLEGLFPEFRAISWLVVRDFYHKHTVDEHTLLTIRNLERLTPPVTPGRERFASLLEDLRSPELLVLALLYHDVGKWKEEDHEVESVRMAHDMFDRLQLSRESREMVEFLIAQHLQMSRVAFRRDTEDPEIVKRFAALVGIEERLKLLSVLTLVDVESVGPGTLTPWKEELLWRLYIDTYNQLTLGYGDELIERNQAGLSDLVSDRPDDLTDTQVAQFLEGFPRRYLQLFSKDAIYEHVRLSRNIKPEDVHLSLEGKGSVWELTVVTLDKPFLFSNISGVLASFGMDIMRGHAMTTPGGLVLDAFQFTDQERYLALNPGAAEHVRQVLADVIAGTANLASLLNGREQSVLNRRAPRIAPLVHCDNQSSQRYSILDINADNGLGLLYRISRLISQKRCEIDLVLISTEGHKAIDVFHITRAGAKLSEKALQRLAGDLQRLLEGHYEVT